MVFFILCIAILNLGLGYGLALYLHSQDKLLTFGAIRGFSLGFKLPWLSKDSDDEIDDPPPARIAETAKPAPTPAQAPVAEKSIATEPQPFVALANEVLSAASTPKPRDTAAAATLAMLDPDPVEDLVSAPKVAISPDVDELAIAAAVEGLKAELSKYRGEVTNLDARLRECAQDPTGPTIRSCADDLRKANHEYLERQGMHRGRIDAESAADQAAPIVRTLAEAVDRQAAIIAAAQAGLTALDQETDLLEQCQQMLNETRQISETNDALDATLGEALTAIASGSRDAADDSRVGASDERREIADHIEAWWQANTDPNLRLSVALIDPDHLGRLNEQYGQTVVDQALRAFGRLVSGGLQAGQAATRAAGQTYLLFLPNVTSREAVNIVERCRQQVDATRFHSGDEKFRVTVSCAVAQTGRTEDAESLVVRLEAMLNEAKRYGRNRTFFQEGSHPSPAVPPALAIEGQVVNLDAAVA